MERKMTDDERALLRHVGMWGSKGYPIQKFAGKWSWGGFLTIKGPPTMFRTKREAIASFETYYETLRRLAGEEAYERAMREKGAAA